MALVIRMLRMLLPRDASHSALRFSRPAHPARGMPLDPDTLRVPSVVCLRLENTMPFAVRGDDPLDAVVNIRLTQAEKARLAEDADLAALSMSELVRRRFFGRPIIANADMVMIKELRRLGGLIKHIHNASEGRYSRETAGALIALKAYLDRLSHDRQKG